METNIWLKAACQRLEKAGISTARLDCLVLLEDILGKDKAFILAHPERKLTPALVTKLDGQIQQREAHTPLAYIRGKTEFYGREFIINKDVLEPRPESETMIDMLKKLSQLTKITEIVDVGTGSGALAITAKLELPNLKVTGVDIEATCLSVARQNAQRRALTITLKKSDLLESVVVTPGAVLLCNLPYVPDDYKLNDAAMNEPKKAIFGGEDGLDLYRRLFKQIEALPHRPAYVLTESLPFQHKALAKIAKKQGFKEFRNEDFIQVFANIA